MRPLLREKVIGHMVGKDVLEQLCVVVANLSHVLKLPLCLLFPEKV